MIQANNVLRLPHGDLRLPAFLPDATRGVVRSLDSGDLEACGVAALVMNTYHLMQHPGSTTIQRARRAAPHERLAASRS